MNVARAGLALVMLSAGCGDGGHSTLDAMPDARVCTATSAKTFDLYDLGEGYVSYAALLDGTIDGYNLYYQLELYGDIEPSLGGTWDLTAGNQSNYQTCAICFRAFAYDAQQNVVKGYFQSAGSITLASDPLVARSVSATVTGLEFQEVDVDNDTYLSTPVPGGSCGSVADTTIEHDEAPNAWTCTPRTDFNAGTACNCECGAYDPDCDSTSASVTGCPNSFDTCNSSGDCTTPSAPNDTCAAATSLTINAAAVSGRTIGATTTYNMGLEGTGCTNATQPGADVVYKVTLTASTAYTVKLTNLSATFDGSISVVGPGDATLCDASPIAACVAGADAGGQGVMEQVMYTPTTGGEYFIIVDSKESAGVGTFSIEITQP